MGKIRDLEARPVVGATVRLARAFRANGDDLTLWIDAVRCRRFAAARTYLYTPAPVEPKERQPVARTDASGHFRLEGVGPEQVAVLRRRAVELTREVPTES